MSVVSRQYVRVRMPKYGFRFYRGMRKPSIRSSCAGGSPDGWRACPLTGCEAMGGGCTAQSQLTTTNGHFGAVSIGSRGIFAYGYPWSHL